MSRLEELIQKYCPDGVEYKTLKEIATQMYRGSGIKREDVSEDGIPCVRYGEIYTTYGIWFDDCVSHTKTECVKSPKYFEYGDILFAITGESVEDIAKSTVYVGKDKCLAGGDIVVLKHNQNPKYLSYALATTEARKQKSAGKVKSKVVHSNIPSIECIRVPIPPIEVQNKIVQILDTFTELTAELTAELSARQKQYEYYRDMLVKFDGQIPGVEYKELSAVCKSLPKGTLKQEELVQDGLYPVVNSGKELYGYYNDFNNDGNAVIVASRGNAGYVGYQGGKFWAGGLCYPYASADESTVSTKYIYYALKARENTICNTLVSKGGVPALNKQDLDDVKIPVPPMDVQQQVVSILDQFYALSNDISTGLPAEIAAREKQYEFFRDKILTFKGVTPPRMILALLIAAELIGVERHKLVGVCKIETGSLNANAAVQNGNYAFFTTAQTPSRIDNFRWDTEALLIAGNANVGHTTYYRGKFDAYQRVYVLSGFTNNVIPKFLYYVLQNGLKAYLNKNKNEAAMKYIVLDTLANYEVPLPPLFIQQAIVCVLDKFESLCADLKEGLPAEIALRQRQYDYYRDALLALPACSH